VQIFHVTTAGEWSAAREAGMYTLSTRDVGLAEEGFIHCSFREQVDGVRQRWYSDLSDIVVLVIETDRLTSPWKAEEVLDSSGSEGPYPHIYGPLNLDAVVDVREL
jgi:glutathione S-transferase